MKIPFLGGAYEGRSKSINAQQSINLFPVVDKQDAKTVLAMYGTPGYSLFSTTGTTAMVRGLHVMGDYLYAVVGNTVYEINSSGTATSLGVLTTSTGHIGMADNGTQLLIVDGTSTGKIVTVGSMSTVSSGDFPASTHCVFFDGYFIVNVVDTGRIQISTLYNGNLWDALDFATAESSPDNLVSIGTTKQNIWLFGNTTTEVYFNSGNADFPFERVPGAILDIGCGAVNSVVEVKGKIYWLTDDGKVVRSKGYSVEIISTPGIEYQLATYTDLTDCMAYTYTLEGRSFYVLNFLTDNKTWVVDIDLNFWHEWKYGDSSHHLGVIGVQFKKLCIIGEYASGLLNTLDMDTYTDSGTNISRVRRAQIINKERLRVLHHKIELDFESVSADVSLRWSDDDGVTWTEKKAVSLSGRVIWRRLGNSRNRIYEISISSGKKIILLNAYSELIVCKS